MGEGWPYARVLHDPAGGPARLQARTAPYPDALATALWTRFEWRRRLRSRTLARASERADVSHLAGCVFRSIACPVRCCLP